MDSKLKEIKQFHNALLNMMQMDKRSIQPVVHAALNPTLRERHLTYSYDRAAMNVEHLVGVGDSKQFQAMTMLTRSVFEIAVEMRMMNIDPKASEKVEAFNNIEKLRAAKRIIAYADKHPNAPVHNDTYREFVAHKEAEIIAEHKRLWPNKKMSDTQHWTLTKLPARAEELGGIFHQIYQANYSELSWYSHGGTTGVMNLTSEAAAHLAGLCYKTTADAYQEVLETIIREFRLDFADDIVRKRIDHARFEPFAETPEEKAGLLSEMGVEMKQPPN